MKSFFIALFAGMAACASVQQASAADAVTYKEKVLYSFGPSPDGANPDASLIDVNGVFYGTASSGGATGSGTVFSFDPSTGAETVVYDFCSKTNCVDGENPYAGLINVNSIFYGTTYDGGAKGSGTVFSLDPSTGTETVLYSFCSQNSCTDGALPTGGLVVAKDKLYGTASGGGTSANCGSACGTIFSVDPGTGTETVLHAFQGGSDGAQPQGSLIFVHGILYGTTFSGGGNGCQDATGCGTVFSVDPGTGTETVLYAFQGDSDGAGPQASLIDVNGILYGTTFEGGGTGCSTMYITGCGTAFSVDPTTGVETILHSFQGGASDGGNPAAGLINVKGTLYGTTLSGGGTGCPGGCGTVFSLDPGTSAETVLYAFGSKGLKGGAVPPASLIHVNHKFYGITYHGGASGNGTVFALEVKR